MKYIKYKTLFLILLSVASFSSCKKYLDVNRDPNNPGDVDKSFILPSAEAAIGHALGYSFQVYGGFYSQYWTQSPSASQYKNIDSYTPAATEFDRPWGMLYNEAIADLAQIEKKGEADGNPNYVGISKVLQAYTYQLLTDNFGDVPFSEANKLEQGISSPHYDPQEQVYNGIIQLLKDGIAKLNEDFATTPASDDMIFNGDMDLWKHFANTLLLRTYLRLSDVSPAVAQAGIQELEANGAEFLAEGEVAQIQYTNTGGSRNPLYEAYAGVLNHVQNIYASETVIDSMDALGDQRIDVLFDPGAGIPQGGFSDPTITTAGRAIPSALTGAKAQGDDASEEATIASAPVKFMTDYESLFLQAEAVARGWMTGDAAALFQQAITASFDTYGLDVTGYAGLEFPATGLSDQLKAIAVQKWLAMTNTQNIEAWTESRRFDYPLFDISMAADQATQGRLPARLFYPSTEVTRNLHFPGQKLITDKVWWDTK